MPINVAVDEVQLFLTVFDEQQIQCTVCFLVTLVRMEAYYLAKKYTTPAPIC